MSSSVSHSAADRVLHAAGPARGAPSVLLMFGELALKGRKRSSFAAVLQRNLRRALGQAGSPGPPARAARRAGYRARGAGSDRAAATVAGAVLCRPLAPARKDLPGGLDGRRAA